MRGGPVAQDRTSGRKRDTVVRTPNPGCGDTVTDLSCTHARDADDCLRHQQRPVTLLYAAKDTEHNHAVVLREYVESLLADSGTGGKHGSN
ncbi:hypothetical protein GCM10027590_37370 [Nocardiopsis nanhaiensis]